LLSENNNNAATSTLVRKLLPLNFCECISISGEIGEMGKWGHGVVWPTESQSPDSVDSGSGKAIKIIAGRKK